MGLRPAIITIIFAAQTLAQAPCYNLGVATPLPSKYVKCANSDMCCRTNDASADTCPQSADLRGLCISQNQDIWRESCTDQKWQSEGCLKLCMDVYVGSDGVSTNRSQTDYRLTRCVDDGSLCCGAPGSDEAGDCCKAKRGVFLDNLKIVSAKPPSASSSQTRLSITRETITSTNSRSTAQSTTQPPTQTPAPSSGSDTNVGAIAGGVVGGVAGILAFVLAGWLLRRHKKGKINHETEPARTDMDPQKKHELFVQSPQAELPGEYVNPVELEATAKHQG
ncbi:hypothetical protein GQ44DRAFT_623379 [Phaeosphaeriaceae sp. PMI808]|nr:hypothetical protein GQ44DRAFT_623379 [Phaeosphaeriaceae sp. PMI808]